MGLPKGTSWGQCSSQHSWLSLECETKVSEDFLPSFTVKIVLTCFSTDEFLVKEIELLLIKTLNAILKPQIVFS